MTWASSNLVRQSLYKLEHFLIKSQIKPCTAFLWEVGYAALQYTESSVKKTISTLSQIKVSSKWDVPDEEPWNGNGTGCGVNLRLKTNS